MLLKIVYLNKFIYYSVTENAIINQHLLLVKTCQLFKR